MDSQASDQDIEGGLIPLSEHPKMDRLAEILESLPEDRRGAFENWLENPVTNKGEGAADDSEQERTD